jgi:hypothetical protein
LSFSSVVPLSNYRSSFERGAKLSVATQRPPDRLPVVPYRPECLSGAQPKAAAVSEPQPSTEHNQERQAATQKQRGFISILPVFSLDSKQYQQTSAKREDTSRSPVVAEQQIRADTEAAIVGSSFQQQQQQQLESSGEATRRFMTQQHKTVTTTTHHHHHHHHHRNHSDQNSMYDRSPTSSSRPDENIRLTGNQPNAVSSSSSAVRKSDIPLTVEFSWSGQNVSRNAAAEADGSDNVPSRQSKFLRVSPDAKRTNVIEDSTRSRLSKQSATAEATEFASKTPVNRSQQWTQFAMSLQRQKDLQRINDSDSQLNEMCDKTMRSIEEAFTSTYRILQ